MSRLEELERLLSAECGKYDKDCTTCLYQNECNEYGKEYENNSR